MTKQDWLSMVEVSLPGLPSFGREDHFCIDGAFNRSTMCSVSKGSGNGDRQILAFTLATYTVLVHLFSSPLTWKIGIND